MVFGTVTGTTALDVVVLSTAFGREAIQILDYDTMQPIGGAVLPPDFGAITGVELVQADADPELEVVIASRAHQSGLGALLLYDAQSNSFKTLAVGTPGAEFATSIEVRRGVPGTADQILVASPGSGEIKVVDPSGQQSLLVSLPVGAGRDGMTQLDPNHLAVRSYTGFLPNVSGRLEVVMFNPVATSTIAVGHIGERFATCTPADSNGAFYWTRSTVGVAEEIFESLSPTAMPKLVVQAPYGTGLEVVETAKFNPFPTSPLGLIGVFERSKNQVSLYNTGAALDLRASPVGVASGSSFQVDVNFGPQAAGASLVALLSTTVPQSARSRGSEGVATTPRRCPIW